MVRRLAFILTTAFWIASPSPGNAATEPRLHGGTWSLEFQVQPAYFSRYPADAGVAAKVHLSERSAVRLGFLVSISSGDEDGTATVDRAYPYDTTMVTTDIDGSRDARDAIVFLHFVRYLSLDDHFGLVLDVGPLVRWQSSEYASNQAFPLPTYAWYRQDRDYDFWAYGGEIQGGFEWFFAKRLSLAGRYGLTALRTEEKETSHYDSYNPSDGYWDRRYEESHTRGFSVETTSAIISLAAYF